MSGPIVFISRNRIKDGMLDDFVKHYQASLPLIEATKPQTIFQISYLSEDSSEVTIVRLFRDAEGMDLQLQGADQKSKITYQYIEPTSIELYGQPNDIASEMINKIVGTGVKVTILPDFIGGFIRQQFPGDVQGVANLLMWEEASLSAQP